MAWPAEGLEAVHTCPYCGGSDRSLAYEAVEDWAFGCAPGRWNYWRCAACQALYLHARPTAATIGQAYARYYTHAKGSQTGRLGIWKQRLRNEYWSRALQTSIAPRLGLPRWAAWTTACLAPWIAEPFGLRQWAQLPKGLMLDVGCGNGDKLKLASQLGWRVRGIEMDVSAVQVAQAQGLQVEQGGYERLAHFQGQVDCLVCSHVLEHVHQPLNMLRLLQGALKPQGVLLLSVPNAASFLLQHYGAHWRGLEAPRHLAIPDATWLLHYWRDAGFDCVVVPSQPLETAMESERMRRQSLAANAADVRAAKRVLRRLETPGPAGQDLIQLVCVRRGG